MRLVVFLAALLTLPGLSFAHTKWFAQGELQPLTTSEPVLLYLTVWALIAASFIAIGYLLEKRYTLQLEFLHPKPGHAFARASSIFSMVAGAFFMIAGAYGYLFSPNLTMESGIPGFLITAQVIIGLAFFLGIAARVAGLGLIALWMVGFLYSPAILMLENLWVVSTGLFILFVGNEYFSLVSFRILGKYVHSYRTYALPLLRLGTGATLLILGFSEKILHPEYGINFLEHHSWNFVHSLGFGWFTDVLFTISAGSVEALFGIIFILGILTRLNALAVAIFFSIPLFILGPMELAGHMPHFAAVVILLMFGAGRHFRVVSA